MDGIGNLAGSVSRNPGNSSTHAGVFWLANSGGMMLKPTSRFLSLALLVVAGLLLAGCPPRETVEKINRDPGMFAGKEISIAGRVTDSFGALGNGVFQIDDGTGGMWVFSKGFGMPGNDAKVAVIGR